MVINIEHGEGNPSIATLLRISDALGVGLPVLVDVERPRELTVTPAGRAPVLWRGPSGGQALLVAGTEPPDVVELWDWTLRPGRSTPARRTAPAPVSCCSSWRAGSTCASGTAPTGWWPATPRRSPATSRTATPPRPTRKRPPGSPSPCSSPTSEAAGDQPAREHRHIDGPAACRPERVARRRHRRRRGVRPAAGLPGAAADRRRPPWRRQRRHQ